MEVSLTSEAWTDSTVCPRAEVLPLQGSLPELGCQCGLCWFPVGRYPAWPRCLVSGGDQPVLLLTHPHQQAGDWSLQIPTRLKFTGTCLYTREQSAGPEPWKHPVVSQTRAAQAGEPQCEETYQESEGLARDPRTPFLVGNHVLTNL